MYTILKTTLHTLLILLISCSNIEISSKRATAPKKIDPTLAVDIVLPRRAPPAKFVQVMKPRPNTKKVQKYCKKIDRYFKKYSWGKSDCDDYTWHHVRNTHFGNPIIWFVFGDEKKFKEKKVSMNTTMIFCGVHGDEITPVKFCFDIIKDLKNNPDVIGDNLVVIAPLVSPDSFMKRRPTRTNGRGVDVNRNFPTRDWKKDAKRLWVSRYKKDKRRFPGKKPLSEQETRFQINIIRLYNPNKVISVHSPLTLLDYDGPSFNEPGGMEAKQLLLQMSHKSGKYKVSNYPFFTGSLGNWAGNERDIPIYTLELPNTDWHKTKRYFNTFRSAIHFAIQSNLTEQQVKKTVTKQEDENEIIL